MKRRIFIKQTAATSAFLGMGGLSLNAFSPANSTKKITILHTNDVHSHIDPFGPKDGRNPNKGGVARRATLIDSIRQENPNTLLLDAGDIFQGTPYFNYYGGELEFKLMSKLKYDAATIGNHEFDNGLEGILAQLPHAQFSFLSANYDFSNTILEGHIKPYQVFEKDGIRIGVFGLGVELDGLVDKNMYKETKYYDPVEISQDITRILKDEEQCHLVICLSHIGYYYKKNPSKICDLTLAAKTKNIDLIIGGHTHTFLDKPTVVKNSENKNVLVNQVGCFGLNLGRIDFYFKNTRLESSEGAAIIV
ncbi:bifunctional metallophosphatase/5'-nucleotidase [Bizionia sediminis]|uniref:Bifunctional metallophosphatase/5'-nucleotidase n=1 Tax=Bizionia sediminis TaxID=1737064 RepID=A0ABW5KWZ2_9FLAO